MVDDPEIAEGYASYIREEHAARIAYDGREALESLDEDVDVVLLDRRMPGLSGDEVLEAIRERGLDCRVAMLMGVDPSLDIVDMGFDDYLRKPISEEELFETVEAMLRRTKYDAKLREYFSLASKRAILETEYDRASLADRERYRELCGRLDRIREELDRMLEELPPSDGYAVAVEGGYCRRDNDD